MHEADQTQHLNACTPVVALSTSLALLDRGRDLSWTLVFRETRCCLCFARCKNSTWNLRTQKISDKFRCCINDTRSKYFVTFAHWITRKQKRFTRAEKINNTLDIASGRSCMTCESIYKHKTGLRGDCFKNFITNSLHKNRVQYYAFTN